jgi:trk system potassium uptake protein TrkH
LVSSRLHGNLLSSVNNDIKIRSRWSLPTLRRKTPDLRIVPVGFLTIILIGTVLLLLPWTHRAGCSVGFLDALFLSTSATCVTGLSPINVAETFNGFGQTVILLLIQIGGLGIFTATLSLVLLSGNRLSVTDEQTIYATVGKLRGSRPFDLFIYACLFVFLFELAGTVALFLTTWENLPSQSVMQTLWESVFHSVSAFCNAGISIYPEGFARWRNEPVVLTIVSLLVIAGGIGLMTLINLRFYRFWRKDARRRGYLTVQTRVTILMTVILLLVGTVITMGFESSHTLKGAGFSSRLSLSFFHSAMTRTAGFNVVDVGAMNPPTLLATSLFMFIGGSPGSMAGGIKTVTFALLLLTAWNALRRTDEIQVFGRRIPSQLSGVATMIAILAAATIVLGIGLLMITEQGQPSSNTSQHWLGLVFEAISAFGTVGLSTGVTPLLTALGKLIIIALMFAGRVGPLVLSVYLARPKKLSHVRFPREEIQLG